LIVISGCCEIDSDCNDGEFCNGKETCNDFFEEIGWPSGGFCETGLAPCIEGEGCDEEQDDCFPTFITSTSIETLTTTTTSIQDFPNIFITVTIDFSNLKTIGDCTGIVLPSTWSDTFTVEIELGMITITQPSTRQECNGPIDSDGNFNCEAQEGQISFGHTGQLNEDGTGTDEVFHKENDCTATWSGLFTPHE
jgi:hypothetical protein